MEDGVETPTGRQIHPISYWRDLLRDGEGPNPPSLDLGWQVGTIILDMFCSQDHFITHSIVHRLARAIYCCSHSLLGKRQIDLCLSQGRLHPFQSDLHSFIRCLGQSTRHQRRRQHWVDARIQIKRRETSADGYCIVGSKFYKEQLLNPSMRDLLHIGP